MLRRARSRIERVTAREPERRLAKARALEYERRLARLDPDVVFALPVPEQSVVGAARFAQNTGCATVVVPFFHLYYERFAKPRPDWLALLRRFSAVLATTQVEAEFLIAHGVVRARVRRPGMFAAPLPKPTKTEIAAFRTRHSLGTDFVVATAAAQFSEPKGSLLLARAAMALPNVQFVFIGGDERSRIWLREEVAFGSNVHLLGFLDEKEKAVALAAANLFALPSRADSFGIVYQEAHSVGTPTLAMDFPVMREVIGTAGFFLPPDAGPKGLVELIDALVSDPDRLAEAAKHTQAVARRYAPDIVCPRIADEIERVARAAGAQDAS